MDIYDDDEDSNFVEAWPEENSYSSSYPERRELKKVTGYYTRTRSSYTKTTTTNVYYKPPTYKKVYVPPTYKKVKKKKPKPAYVPKTYSKTSTGTTVVIAATTNPSSYTRTYRAPPKPQPKYELGESCSRDSLCKSSCCAYNFDMDKSFNLSNYMTTHDAYGNVKNISNSTTAYYYYYAP